MVQSQAILGNDIVGVVKESIPNIDVKRSEVVRAFVFFTRFNAKRDNESFTRFDENAVVFISNPRGSRVFSS